MIRRVITAPGLFLGAILILDVLIVLGWINSSPRPRRDRRYAAIGAREMPSAPREWIVFGRPV